MDIIQGVMQGAESSEAIQTEHIEEILQETPCKETLERVNLGFEEGAQATPNEGAAVEMEHIEVQESPAETPDAEVEEGPQPEKPDTEALEKKNKEAKTEQKEEEASGKIIKPATAFVCLVNLAYVIATAYLIGKLKGWAYATHCFILSLLILFSFVQTVRAKNKLSLKSACWVSCSTLAVVLMTTFTLLTRQAYYYPSKEITPEWVLFTLQASIIPLICNILVMYECNIKKLCEDRFILMIAILDFADIWDMASILSQDKSPFLKEESPIEIAVQFFCSLSFSIFSLLIYKNISQEGLKSIFKFDQSSSKKSQVNHELVARSNSQLYQNIPFLIIRIIILLRYNVFEFDYIAKNSITVILAILDVYGFVRDKYTRTVKKENQIH